MLERDAYEIACRFVRQHYFDLLPLAGAVRETPIAKVTADARRSPGTWSIPDVTGVRAVRLPMYGLSFTEVHAFEIKRANDFALPAAYEAAAQTRRAHFGSVICHTGETRREPDKLEEVKQACTHFGLGLFVLWGQDAARNHETIRLPNLNAPAPDAIESLLQSLFAEDRDEIAAWHRRD